MNAASCVIVTSRLGRQDRPVSVAGDQDVVIIFGPLAQADFTFVFDVVVFGGAGGIQYAHIFQRTPDIADEEAGEGPECGIEQTGLMSVC